MPNTQSFDQLNPGYTPPANAAQNEQGYWILPNGDLAPGQITPGKADQLAQGNDTSIHWDASGKPYMLQHGAKFYPSPAALQGSNDPQIQAWVHAVGPQPQNGLIHGMGQWNTDKGQWDQGVDWGNIASLGIAGALTGGLASALGGGGAAGAGAATASSEAAPGAAGAGALLPSTITAPLAGTLPLGASSGVVGAAGGLASGAGDAISSLLPSSSLAGSASVAAPSALPLGATSGAVEASGLGGIVPGSAVAGAPTLSSSGLTGAGATGVGPETLPLGASSGVVGAAGSGGSVINDLMGGANKAGALGKALTTAGSAIGAATGTAANNRSEAGKLTQGYDNLKLEAQQDQRAQTSDALKKLVVAKYLSNGGSTFKLPSSIHLGNGDYSVPDLGFGPTPASADQIKGAGTLSSNMLAQLNPANNFQPTPLSSYAQPSTLENVGNAASTALGVGGAIANLLSPPRQQTYTYDPKTGGLISSLLGS